MNKFYAILALALTATFASAADTPADTTQPPAEKKREEVLSYRERMTMGKVADTKEVNVTLEGKTETHILAKVNTTDDHVIIVDLGPRAGLKTEIKIGDEIVAFGTVGRLNQRPLIVASKVATIVPIEGREQIYESIPTNYQPGDAPGAREHSEVRDGSNQAIPVSSDRPPAFLLERLERMNNGSCCR